MHTVVSYTAAVCFDAALFYLLGCGAAPLLPVFGSNDVAGLLAFLWSAAAIRWALICSLWLPTVDQTSRPVMRRWAAVHCFLGSVYESGRIAAFGGPLETGIGPVGSPGFTFLTSIAAAAACMFWEFVFPDTNGEDDGKGKQQKARVLFMRVISLYKPDYLLLLGAFVFLSLAVLCEMFIPYYTGKVIDILGAQYHWHDFLTAIFFMGLFSIGSSLSSGCRGGLFMCAINNFTSRMKVKLFSSLVRQEIGFFETTKTGDITSRLSMDTTLMARTVALNVNVLLRTLIKTLGMLSLMFSLSWKLTVLMLMETPITGFLQNIHDTYYQRLSKEVQDSIARGNDAAGEAVGGIRTVRSFSAEQREATRYGDKLTDTHSLKTRRDTVRAVYLLLRRLTELGMQVAMLYYGRRFIQSGQMSTGNLVSFILYQTDLGQNIRTLIYIFGDMLNSVSAAGKVFEYLDRKPQVSTDGTLQPDTLRGHVQLRNLTFSYPTRPDEPALQGLSLELKPGQVTALVGPSGGGKTTCVSLLEGFYQPQGGEILLDGQPLHSYQHKYLHSKVAMVGQDPVLFSGSVRDNIAYSLKDCPLEVVQKAAQRANAHDFISQLEHGYDTDVGERGGQLSGGQKQRIAIARALIREPQVLILDEVTSCLDTESEHVIQQALADRPSQTLLIIAHRLKTVERADQIILIDKGAVLERGTHQELMDKRGSYFRLREKIFTENGEQNVWFIQTRTMHTSVSYTVAVCFDAALFYLLGCGAAPLLPVFGSNDVTGLLAFLWSVAAIRWGLICSLWLPTVDQTSRPVMRRWAAVHCFLGSVYESGRIAVFGGPLETGIGPVGSPGFTFLTSIAAAAACMFWEVAFPDTNGEGNGKGKQQKARVLFMRVISFCQPDYLILLGAYVFLFLAVLFELFALLQTGKLIDSLGVEHQRHKFPSVLLSMALFSFGSSLFTAAREGFFSCAISSFSCRIKLKLFHSLVRQEIGFFDSTKTGDICSRLSTDTSLTGRAVSLSINLLLRSLIEFLGIAFVMLRLSWKLTLLVLMEMPLNSLLQSVYNIYFQRFSKRVHDSLARANDAVGEAAAGIRTVRSFRAEHVEARRYGDRLMDVHKLRIRREAVRAVHALMRKVTDQGLWLAMLYSGIKLIESGHMSTGTLVFFMFYQRDLGNRIKTLIYIFGDVLNSVSVAEKVFEYQDRKPQVSTDGTLQPDTLRGHVQLCNLTFSYPTRPELPVLQGLSLELKPGQVTALVGPSGGGKTTCVSLLEGFYQPQGGKILLDRQPLHSYQHKYLHSKVAMVGQDPVLFSGSVRDNITYGLEDCPLEVVQEAAQRANAHDFISQLEHGYDTDVGERGGQLSGGQKQRIAIARALIREPQVLILDEVTSCLDVESEHTVLQALASHPTQSILIIAHRLKTVQRADQIFLIDHGVVVERGTHLELMGKKGKYYRLQEKVFMEESPG
ncbi:antigen peptide transporter 2a [Paramormyrops kingsleyae]|uniref:antigen peptide transporter 2a n=1 Tax=Paramormyrops kingsleyae TaxID=1676925 RepID=UPI003B973E14